MIPESHVTNTHTPVLPEPAASDRSQELAALPSQSGSTSDLLTVVARPDVVAIEPPVAAKAKCGPRKKTIVNNDAPIEAVVGRATRSKTRRV